MERTINYAYHYAWVDPDTNMCLELISTSAPDGHLEDPCLVPVPEYNDAYLLKYYNREDGKWYMDAEFTVEAEGLN